MPARKQLKSVSYVSRSSAYMAKGKSARAAKVSSYRKSAVPHIKGAIAPFGGRKELKYCDTTLTTKLFTTTGSVSALNLIAVGDDNTSRDGRQVTCKSIQLRGTISPPNGIAVPVACRWLLVWDNAVNSGTIATIGQILTSATSTAFPLVDNQQRFTILHDSVHFDGVLNLAATTSVADRAGHVINVYKKLNSVTQYSGTTAAIGSIQNGGLLFVTVGDQSGSGSDYSFSGQARLRFVDQ